MAKDKRAKAIALAVVIAKMIADGFSLPMLLMINCATMISLIVCLSLFPKKARFLFACIFPLVYSFAIDTCCWLAFPMGVPFITYIAAGYEFNARSLLVSSSMSLAVVCTIRLLGMGVPVYAGSIDRR